MAYDTPNEPPKKDYSMWIFAAILGGISLFFPVFILLGIFIFVAVLMAGTRGPGGFS